MHARSSIRLMWTSYSSCFIPRTCVWHVAIICGNKRVVVALEALATSPRYRTNPHVDFTHLIGHAVLHVQSDLAFLDWLYKRFSQPHERQISVRLFEDAAKCCDKDIAVLHWVHAHGYEFPASMMDVAAEFGNTALMRFLHERGTNGCSTRAMDEAARLGRLEIVRFLHEHRSEGCTQAALSAALANGFLSVVQYLHAHRSEGYSASAVNKAAALGQLSCIAFAHAHDFDGFSVRTMSEAMVAGHLDVVQFLHEHRTEGCTLEALLEAEKRGKHAVVDYLCRHRPMKSPSAAITEATQRGLKRLAAKLKRGQIASLWTKQLYEYGESSRRPGSALFDSP